METVDDEIRDHGLRFVEQSVRAGKPFFLYLNPTRMHVVTHLSEKYQKLRTPENGWSLYEAGMAQLDDIVGDVMKKLDDLGVADSTIVVFSTDNGAENFTWPDGGQTPFAGAKGTVLEGGFRVPCILRWPGKVPAGKVENGLVSSLDWFPTFVAAAGNPHIVQELQHGKKIGGRSYKVHLDGYDQTDFFAGLGPSKRRELYYFAEATLGAVRLDDYKYRFIDQPNGWLGGTVKVDWPIVSNVRLDPFERTGLTGSINNYSWTVYQFWRFVFVQEEVAKFAKTFVDFPPMQPPASFNLEAVKEQVVRAINSHAGQ
jgi:arylsulfatase